jgi:flagellar operon protein
MTDRIQAGQFHVPIHVPVQLNRNSVASTSTSIAGQRSFQDILQDKLIHFSNHAEVRLQQRGIQFSKEQMTQLESAVSKADAKGAKDSLILFKDVALIVNVKNRTVVTAMDGNQLKDNVFTKIDSAVIIS